MECGDFSPLSISEDEESRVQIEHSSGELALLIHTTIPPKKNSAKPEHSKFGFPLRVT